MIACNEGQVEIVRLLLDLNNIDIPNSAELLFVNQWHHIKQSIKKLLEEKWAIPLVPQRTNSEADPIEPIEQEIEEVTQAPREAETYDELLEDLDFIVESDETDNDEESDDTDNDTDDDN